jgi:cytidylate kinase
MALVMISSLYQGGREELAGELARKSGWPILSREELLESAKLEGIRVGRLEMSMIKRSSLTEKLAREKKLYLAFITANLCRRALEGNLIYSGRAGHLMLPGSRKLRVGLSAPLDIRIKRTAKALDMQLDQAESYLAQLDEDIDKWVRQTHHASGQDPTKFDVFINLENMTVSNAADTLFAISQLPEYQNTPSSKRVLEDLYLSAQAELKLIMDDRTKGADLRVKADTGFISVTYPPHQEQFKELIPEVLAGLDGCREIYCTMAATNILWVQERFDPKSESFEHIMQLAQRWGAAVELMRLVSPAETQEGDGQINMEYEFGPRECPDIDDGGVEDDDPLTAINDGGLSATIEELIDRGRCGGGLSICGGYDKILERVQGDVDYALVVVGDMFLSKGKSTRTRRTREMAMTIRDRLKAPVITADELESKFMFGKRQALSLVGYCLIIGLLYYLVFTNQEQVLTFLSGPLHEKLKWLAPAVIFMFVPVIAYLWGSITGLALKLINID